MDDLGDVVGVGGEGSQSREGGVVDVDGDGVGKMFSVGWTGVGFDPCLDVGGKESGDVVTKVGEEVWGLGGVLRKEGAED